MDSYSTRTTSPNSMKRTIGNKILFGYVPVSLLLLVISLFTLLRLHEVNRINNEIVTVDISVGKIAEDMIEILLAQESYSQRYMILKSQDMLSLFWKRDQEFINNYQRIKTILKPQTPMLTPLEPAHLEYNKYFQTGVSFIDSLESYSYTLIDSLRKNAFAQQISYLKELSSESKKKQMEKTLRTAEIGRYTFQAILIFSVLGIAGAVLIATFITRGIVASIKTLTIATDFVSKGNFKDLPTVSANDELGDLSQAFNTMAIRLIQLEETFMDSSPLTRLPGGLAIENAIKNLIECKRPFAFCMLDLDNFKPFNDRYGYSRGNSVIKNTAKIILESTHELGDKDDFIGHIGGDDFVVITHPDKYPVVCEKIIESFDSQIIDFYNPEDRENGYILSKNRQGKRLSFPIMTISIAVVSSEKTPIDNYIQLGEIIAELKKYAKSFRKSNIAIDRRGNTRLEQVE